MFDHSKASKLILIVEDDAFVSQMIRDRLKLEGYQTLAALCGKEAVSCLVASHPTCVLLDLSLPDMDGFEVLKRVKAYNPSLPVIIVTGNHDESEGRRAIEMGARDYITKPIDFIYLLNELAMQGSN